MLLSFILFSIFVIIYIAILDVITILFRLTGMTEGHARFQAISLLTNSGFTTQESELITNSLIRRKLAKVTMVFGYAFTVTIASTLVNMFMAMSSAEMYSVIVSAPLTLLILFGMFLLRSNRRCKAKFDAIIERQANRLLFHDKTNPIILLNDYGNMVVSQVTLRKVPACLKGTQLKDSKLKDENHIIVMMIRDSANNIVQASGETVLRENENVVVLGANNDIYKVFACPDEKI